MGAMSKPKTDRTETYTYADYLTWDGPERWELIDGVPYMMASPTPAHQHTLGQLFIEIGGYLRNKPCTAYVAPLDVTFEKDEDTKVVVQPDLFVMCGNSEHDKRIIGVPILVIEVLSPTTAANDLVRKMNLYQRVGVQEYWIVEPDEKIVNVYLYADETLRWTAEYKPGNVLSPKMFPELVIDINIVFS